jgi:anti-sigma regulatory factor (Ser/Thr protein kinase)
LGLVIRVASAANAPFSHPPFGSFPASNVESARSAGKTREVVLNFHLECDVDSARRTRRSLEPLRGVLGEDLFEDVRLLTNELVTNSVLHSGSEAVDVRAEVREDKVHVEVLDRGGGQPEVGDTQLLDTSGRGLILVGAIADRWGVSRKGGTVVWFEINRAA